MSHHQTAINCALLCLAALSLSSCAGGRTVGGNIADMPHWMGGLPADARHRKGSDRTERRRNAHLLVLVARFIPDFAA
jgi:hypothetical protein